VVTRRSLLLVAGGAVVLAGCGTDDETPPRAALQVMLGQLAAERALAHELSGAAGVRRRIFERSADRARRLASAIAAAGGAPHDAGAPDSPPDPGSVVARARTALERHVTALPSLTGELRALGADLVSESAADAAVLAGAGEAFPGTPR
jgi:hypothetical protein